MGGKKKESETLYRKVNIRKLYFRRTERHCSTGTGSYSQSLFTFFFLVFLTGRCSFSLSRSRCYVGPGNPPWIIRAMLSPRARPCWFPGFRFSPPIFGGGLGGGRSGKDKTNSAPRPPVSGAGNEAKAPSISGPLRPHNEHSFSIIVAHRSFSYYIHVIFLFLHYLPEDFFLSPHFVHFSLVRILLLTLIS